MPSIELLIVLAVVAYIGACFGSLINVIIYRLPKIMEREWLGECLNYLRDLLLEKKPQSNDEVATNQEKATELPLSVTQSEQFPWINNPSDRRMADLIICVEKDNNIHDDAAPFNLSVPRSHCPSCQVMIPWYRNIPLFTWLIQKGRANCCGAKIASRYFFIEVFGALLTTAAVAYFGLTITAIMVAVFLLMLLALAGIDWETRLLPDKFTLSLLWLGLLANIFPLFVNLSDAVIGAVAGYGVLWSIFQIHHLITKREGMGFGDFKLTAAFGAWLGWQSLPFILVIASLIGIVGALATMRVRNNPQIEPIPFGPSLCLAAAIYLFYGKYILIWLGY